MIEIASAIQTELNADSAAPSGDSQALATGHELLDQVERILRSDEFHGSGVLRRLLKFLAEKSVCGDADDLKEYTVAVDGLGKPTSYDPRHDSAARIQVGRLRQKLADYYRGEGQHDPLVIDVPKGRFKLKYEIHDGAAESIGAIQNLVEFKTSDPSLWQHFNATLVKTRLPVVICAGVLLAIALGAAYNWLRPAKATATSIAYTPAWSADMEELWRPFIATDRPTIVAIEDPLFVELDGKKGVYYRDKTLNNWQDVTASPSVNAVRGALKSAELAPSRYYTAFGEVDASFLIAKTLGSRIPNLAVVKTTDLSIRQVTDNNVVFVGLENLFFTDKIQAAPLETPLEPVHDGIRNVHPAPGEPALFIDDYSTAPKEEGTAYALVSHLPGPLAGNNLESFTSSRSAGYVAAVKAFTDPVFVRSLVGKLKESNAGQMPRYYQVLLKVKFSEEEPVEITYVLARELRYPGKS